MEDKELQAHHHPRNEDEDGDLALAIALQEELDRLGFESFPSSVTLRDEIKRLVLGIEQTSSSDAPFSSNWKVANSDEEYARQLQAEEVATSTPAMSDEEFARLIQLQFDSGIHVNGGADPADKNNGKDVMRTSVSSTLSTSRTELPSPPSTPRHPKSPAPVTPPTFWTSTSHSASDPGLLQLQSAPDLHRTAQIENDEDFALRLQMEYDNAGVVAPNFVSNYSLPHRHLSNTHLTGMLLDHPRHWRKM